MSLQILKAGILDTIQDGGRFGYQHLGINPGGAMDRFSMQLANALLGKDLEAAVVELHFPAAEILFEEANIICISGADFSASINNEPVSNNQPIAVTARSVLRFHKKNKGERAYVSFLNDLQLSKWLGSYSTNLKASAGGFNGRKLCRGDQLQYASRLPLSIGKNFTLPWQASPLTFQNDLIDIVTAPEWHWMTEESIKKLTCEMFVITPSSDRMGYKLNGEALRTVTDQQLVSSPVTFGTIQLLPGGQLIILMADHQTTGGYPRVAQVIAADLPRLAQMSAGTQFKFEITDLHSAENKLNVQQKYLQQLQSTCKLKMEKVLYAN